MAAPAVSESQSFAYSGTADESHLSSDNYFAEIVISNSTSVSLAVAVDGGTAGSGNSTNELSCPPNSVCVYDNEMPLPNAGVPGTDRTAATGWTVQSGWHGASAMTVCSVIPQASATGTVSIGFQ
jgi:hypothetical protein